MKTIQLNTLTLTNFKCHEHLRLEPKGASLSVFGDNGTGKTSVYDAFVWLLYGKDSLGTGEKNFDVKPLDGWGFVKDRLAVTAVEAELTVDGVPLTLRRTFQEKWRKHRGKAEAVSEGNRSEYYVNSQPVKKLAFDAAVKELIDEDLFRLLTSVTYFAGTLKWQDRRALLFDLAGAMTDGEIMAQSSEFDALAAEVGKKDLGSYREKLLKKKRELAGKRDDIPARLSECHQFALLLEEEAGDAEEGLDALRMLENQLMALGEQRCREALSGKLKQRMETLAAEAAAVEATIARIEKSLFAIEEFTRFKARFLEESINSHFRLASFRLFREQNNGGLEERCDACFGGIPWSGLNNAMRVNLGIDIINTLSRHFGVSVPLFLDNAEAVTRLEECGAQVIRLAVSPGDALLRTE